MTDPFSGPTRGPAGARGDSSSSPGPAGASAGGPASGGERPAASADRPVPDNEAAPAEEASNAYSDSVIEGAGPAAESADRFPPEAGREAEPVLDPAAGEPDASDAEADTTEPLEEDPIAVLTGERDDYRNALIHMQADFENYKKRMLKQQTDHLERAAEALVDKLLPVLDTADLALAHGGGEDVKQVSAALGGILEREGLERIDPVGAAFDPTLHDAVALEPGDGGEQHVVEVLRAGYRWKGRVLRPAMVKVRG